MQTKSKRTNQPTGLVLSGGGARGAYQAGVLKAVADILAPTGIDWPFAIMTGLSAGAINCVQLASNVNSFKNATEQLASIWANIAVQSVFRTDPASLSAIGARWAASVASGGLTLSKKPQSLVDTTPLHRLITRHLNVDGIDENLSRGRLQALCISATEYATSRGVSFIHGAADSKGWQGHRSFAVPQRIRPEHVLASSAIPLLFPAVKIGTHYYGDGCLRNLTPLSPAIRLGAKRLFVIGVRRELQMNDAANPAKEGASAGRILSVLLNAVLMDGLEADLDNLNSLNQLVMNIKCDLSKYRYIPTLMIRPSKDLSDLAMEFEYAIPGIVRFLTLGLGPLYQTAEMISYLLFAPDFCRALTDLGYQDAMNQRDEIRNFFKF